MNFGKGEKLKIIKSMHIKFYLGILFFLLSLLQFLLPKEWVNIITLAIGNLLFTLGIIFISEGITLKLKNKSLLNEILKNAKNLFVFIGISILGGVVLDGTLKWLGKFWIYPYLNMGFYLGAFIAEFAMYWLMVVESYLAIKTIIDYLRKGKQTIRRPFAFEARLYKFLGVLGLAIVIFTSVFIFIDYQNSKLALFSKHDLINVTANYKVSTHYFFLLFFGLWFILEFIEYSRKKTSLLKDIIHNYFSPICAILIGSFILAVVMEVENIPLGFWVYVNVPWAEIKFIGLPILMFIGWPLHYILFLSLFRALTQKESDEIWSGDKIK